MVYSVRSERPIVAKGALNRTRVKGEYAKKIDQFIEKNTVSVKVTPSGETIVKAQKKHG